MRISPALASVYMTSSLRPSSARPVCTRLFGLKCIGGAAKDVANVRHGDAPFVHPPVAVGSWSNLHDIMIQRAGTPRRMPRPVNGEVELRADRGSWRSSTHFGG